MTPSDHTGRKMCFKFRVVIIFNQIYFILLLKKKICLLYYFSLYENSLDCVVQIQVLKSRLGLTGSKWGPRLEGNSLQTQSRRKARRKLDTTQYFFSASIFENTLEYRPELRSRVSLWTRVSLAEQQTPRVRTVKREKNIVTIVLHNRT